jgi:hypothetical protein
MDGFTCLHILNIAYPNGYFQKCMQLALQLNATIQRKRYNVCNGLL